MSTRGNVLVLDEHKKEQVVLVNVYNHSDSYPEGLGAQIAHFLSRRVLVNGIGMNTPKKASNTIEDLAAQLVFDLKGDCDLGGVYLTKPEMSIGENDYTYIIAPVYRKKRKSGWVVPKGIRVVVYRWKEKIFEGSSNTFCHWIKSYGKDV